MAESLCVVLLDDLGHTGGLLELQVPQRAVLLYQIKKSVTLVQPPVIACTAAQVLYASTKPHSKRPSVQLVDRLGALR